METPNDTLTADECEDHYLSIEPRVATSDIYGMLESAIPSMRLACDMLAKEAINTASQATPEELPDALEQSRGAIMTAATMVLMPFTRDVPQTNVEAQYNRIKRHVLEPVFATLDGKRECIALSVLSAPIISYAMLHWPGRAIARLDGKSVGQRLTTAILALYRTRMAEVLRKLAQDLDEDRVGAFRLCWSGAALVTLDAAEPGHIGAVPQRIAAPSVELISAALAHAGEENSNTQPQH